MTHFILIPLLPLLASLILLLGGRRWGENSHLIGIPAIGLSFVLSVAAFIEVLKNGPFTVSLYRLFQSGSLTIDLTLYVDQLAFAFGHRSKRGCTCLFLSLHDRRVKI